MSYDESLLVFGMLTQQFAPYSCAQLFTPLSLHLVLCHSILREERRGAACASLESVTVEAVQQMEADHWPPRIRARLPLARHARLTVFWLSVGLGSQRPSRGGVISISASCIRRRSLTHDTWSGGSPAIWGLHRPAEFYCKWYLGTCDVKLQCVKHMSSSACLDRKKTQNKTMKTQFMSQLQPNGLFTPNYIWLLPFINILSD